MLILASASTGRKKLLDQIGIEHKVIISNVIEGNNSSYSSKEIVQKLAIEKAECVVRTISSDDFRDPSKGLFSAVLACDSLFDFDGDIYGKPKNAEEAFDRLQKMSGSFGFINTGHCLIPKKMFSSNLRSSEFNSYEISVITSKVYFSKLTDFEIKKYIDSKEPFQCAGGFAIDGKAGLFIEGIEGCFSNVIGLSLPWLRTALLKTNKN